MRRVRSTRFVGTLSKINRRLAALTDMFTVEFIGEDLFFRAALLTLADEGLEVTKGFKAWAMTWGIHAVLLFC